ncbi:hypothetical protein GCM10023322_05690 [Rugosimonospora acidiphila]|uniref:DUF883 domain-containing protein n=1 Tax=Rugosimonospora acidiphila TaxID=556531 RepID=A0ABP9RIP1_9ACTN
MGSQWGGRTREAERVTTEAFHELVAAVEAGGHGAKSLVHRGVGLAHRGLDLADEAGDRLGTAGERLGSAGDRIGSAMNESRRRAAAAMDALAGRRAPIQWEWIAAGAVTGLVVGWLASRVTRRAAEEALVLEDVDSVVADEEPGHRSNGHGRNAHEINGHEINAPKSKEPESRGVA